MAAWPRGHTVLVASVPSPTPSVGLPQPRQPGLRPWQPGWLPYRAWCYRPAGPPGAATAVARALRCVAVVGRPACPAARAGGPGCRAAAPTTSYQHSAVATAVATGWRHRGPRTQPATGTAARAPGPGGRPWRLGGQWCCAAGTPRRVPSRVAGPAARTATPHSRPQRAGAVGVAVRGWPQAPGPGLWYSPEAPAACRVWGQHVPPGPRACGTVACGHVPGIPARSHGQYMPGGRQPGPTTRRTAA